MSLKRNMIFAVASVLVAGTVLPAFANGVGEGRSYQFRTDNQRQVLLGVERLRLEQAGLLGGAAGLGTGCGQHGNTTSINVVNSPGATIIVEQEFVGDQSVGGAFQC